MLMSTGIAAWLLTTLLAVALDASCHTLQLPAKHMQGSNGCMCVVTTSTCRQPVISISFHDNALLHFLCSRYLHTNNGLTESSRKLEAEDGTGQ